LAPKSLLVVDFLSIKHFTRRQLNDFDCGHAEMNRYLHQMAKTNDKKNLSPCLLVVPKGKDEPILGYVSVLNSTVEKGFPPAPQLKGFPNYPIPVMLIGRLAVSIRYQSQGIGKRILMHVFVTHVKAVRELGIGSVGVVTDAIDENAVCFYKKHDFNVLPGQETFPKRMFIPNATVFDAYDGTATD